MATQKAETPAAAFKRLATSRVNKALTALQTIGKLGSPNYSYTDKQIAAIEKALNDATKNAIARLRNPGAPSEGGFVL